MSMQHTPGHIKAFVEVWYTNSQGVKHHMMSFQLATADTRHPREVERVKAKAVACEYDHSQMQSYIRDAIATVEKNDYQLSYVFGVSA